jgi:hypothetical protein
MTFTYEEDRLRITNQNSLLDIIEGIKNAGIQLDIQISDQIATDVISNKKINSSNPEITKISTIKQLLKQDGKSNFNVKKITMEIE